VKLSFLEAVRKKYASEEALDPQSVNPSTQIEISGKVVEEVGFEKIRQQLSRLHELKNVILEDYRVGIGARVGDDIHSTCPMIEHLDLSKNLIENFYEIIVICNSLPNLNKLKIKYGMFSPKRPLTNVRSVQTDSWIFRRITLKALHKMSLTNIGRLWSKLQN
jgi:hypothetical protein